MKSVMVVVRLSSNMADRKLMVSNDVQRVYTYIYTHTNQYMYITQATYICIYIYYTLTVYLHVCMPFIVACPVSSPTLSSQLCITPNTHDVKAGQIMFNTIHNATNGVKSKKAVTGQGWMSPTGGLRALAV